MNTLEQQIANTITEGLASAIKSRLDSYNSPLQGMIDVVVTSRAAALKTMMEEAVDDALKGDFREALKEAVTHKLARVMASKMEGEIEKRANELRASPEARAKMLLAVTKAIEGILISRHEK